MNYCSPISMRSQAFSSTPNPAVSFAENLANPFLQDCRASTATIGLLQLLAPINGAPDRS
jgi:hypothetical protein